MRFNNYILEDIQLEEKFEKIIVNCSQYFEEFGKLAQEGLFFWRGTNKTVYDIGKFIPRKNRAPLDTSINIHNYMNNLFYKNFGWKARSEGIFVTSNFRKALRYGNLVIFIPLNGYKYIYSKSNKYGDMYYAFNNFYDENPGNNVDFIMAAKRYINTCTDKNAVKLLIDNNDNEVMFKCKSYYLINGKYDTLLMKKYNEYELR